MGSLRRGATAHWGHGCPAPPLAELQLGVQACVCRGEHPARPPVYYHYSALPGEGARTLRFGGLWCFHSQSMKALRLPNANVGVPVRLGGCWGGSRFSLEATYCRRASVPAASRRTLMLRTVFWGSWSLLLTAFPGELQWESGLGESEAKPTNQGSCYRCKTTEMQPLLEWTWQPTEA